MSGHYLPGNAAQFDLFVQNMLSYIKNNQHLWRNIPSEAADNLFTLYSEFSVALRQAKETPTTAYKNARNEAQKALARAIRAFVNQYLRFDPVTNKDRDKMRIPNRDTIRTVRVDVTEAVDFIIAVRDAHRLAVDFWVAGSTSKARLKGAVGGMIYWHIGNESPKTPEDCRYNALATRRPFVIDFAPEYRGQTVWITVAWKNARGNRGPLRPFKSAMVP